MAPLSVGKTYSPWVGVVLGVWRKLKTIIQDTYIYGVYIFPLLLSSFWTRRSHRCLPFFPPVLASNIYRAEVSAINPTARRFFIECF